MRWNILRTVVWTTGVGTISSMRFSDGRSRAGALRMGISPGRTSMTICQISHQFFLQDPEMVLTVTQGNLLLFFQAMRHISTQVLMHIQEVTLHSRMFQIAGLLKISTTDRCSSISVVMVVGAVSRFAPQITELPRIMTIWYLGKERFGHQLMESFMMVVKVDTTIK